MESEDTEEDSMKKCPNTECGVVGTWKFCQECGVKMVEEPKTGTVVICDGKRDDGSVCGAELTSKKKFCLVCGKKIDLSLFDVVIESCLCGALLEHNATFCGECGQKRTKSTEEPSRVTVPLTEDGSATVMPEVKDKPTGIDNHTVTEHIDEDTGTSVEDNEEKMRQDTPVTNENNDSECKNTDSNVCDDDVVMKDPSEEQHEMTKHQQGNIVIVHENTPDGVSPNQNDIQPQIGKLKIIDDTPEDNVSDEGMSANSSGANEDIHLGDPESNGGSVKRNVKQKVGEEKKMKYEQETPDQVTEDSDSKLKSDDAVGGNDSQALTKKGNELDHKLELNEEQLKSNPGSTFEDDKGKTTAEVPSDSDGTMVFGGSKLNTSKNDSTEPQQQTSSQGSLFTLSSAKNSKHETQAMDTDPVLPAKEDDENGNAENVDNKREDLGTDVDRGVDRRETRSMAQSGNDNKKNKNKQNNQQSTKDEQRPKATGGRKPGEKCIAVEFHVITSKDFKFDPSTHDCIIVFGNEELGGWNNASHTLKVERILDEYVYHLKYDKYIPTRLISGGQTTPYKYLIILKKTDKKNTDKGWEHYIKGRHTGNGINRELSVQIALKKIDVWKQFDYYIERKPKGFTGMVSEFFSWRTVLKEHIEKSLLEFCPAIPDDQKNSLPVENIRYQFKMLIECARKIYFTDANCWSEYKDFMKWMSQCLLTTVAIKWNMESTSIQKQNSIGSLMCLYVMDSCELDMPDMKTSIALCKNLLVKADDDKQECPDVLHAERIFSRKELLDAVLRFVKNILKNTKNPCWLTVMPWVHFLSGTCIPFQSISEDVKHDETDPKWWGVSSIKNEVDSFKTHSKKWEIPLEKMLNFLKPLFKVDYLLPRSFIAAVELADLQNVLKTREIPIEVCLAHLTYRAKTIKPSTWYDRMYGLTRLYSMSTGEQTVQDCVKTVLAQLQETFFSEDFNMTQWRLSYMIASDLFHASVKNKRVQTIYSTAQVFVHCVAMYDKILEIHKPDKEEDTKHCDITRSCARHAVDWLETFGRWDTEMKDILDVWNNSFAPTVLPSENVKTVWNTVLSEALLKNLKRKVCTGSILMETFVQLYCVDIDKYNPCMQECMGKAAFFAIAQGYTLDYGKFTSYENKRFGSLLSEMFVSEWKKNVKTGTTSEDATMLTHVLRWPPLPQYLKLYYKDQNKIEMLTEECLQGLVQAVSIIDGRLKALLTSAITIGDLQMISEKGGKFPELAELVQSEVNAACVEKVLTARQRELEAFQVQAKEMSTLASLCQHLGRVNTTTIDNTLKKQQNIEMHQIREFCRPVNVKNVSDIESYVPSLCAFPVSDKVLSIVPTLCSCYGSSTFVMFWTNQCQQLRNKCSELDDVFDNVWLPVKDSYDTTTQAIKTGEIKFTEFEKALGHRYKEMYDQISGELAAMNVPQNVISQRVNQLKQYRQLEACVKGAKVILAFKNEYELTGDFKQIRIIATHGENTMEMRAFDDTVMKACAFLHDLTNERAKCLHTFVQCGKLVNWLKESMKKGGLKELKVFVDLAFLSAGDEPMNIARVQCLHSAVTGYAPLIFELTPDCGYKQLLEHCAIVWKELEANPNLPKMLADTNNQLEWMVEIKKAHGSVEVTSLMQTEAINDNGVYTIGKNAWKRRNQIQNDDSSLLSLADILELAVNEKTETKAQKGKQHFRSYTFSQLQDLQSRLMLVAGKAEKGTDSVEKFTMIFDGLTRLSNVYLKLCSSGCVLFKDWTARFFCDPNPNRPVCVILAFGQGDGAPQMKGRRSSTEDLMDIVPEIAKFMEKCLEEWLKYIKEKRKSYLHLNYFTVDQLVILQRELMKVGPESEPSHLIYPLLSAVKQDCSPNDLLEAMSAAKKEIDSLLAMENEENEIGTMEEDVIARENAEGDAAAANEEKRRKFVKEVVDAGYDEALALEALNHVDIDDITQGIVWCMDHDEMSEMSSVGDENEEMIEEESAKKPSFSGWSQSHTDMQALITQNISGLEKHSDIGVKPLIDDLTELWKQFLECISSNIRDYLSLEHLGLILRYLSAKDTRELDRTFSPVFKEGRPNLIICPSADVLMTTLSIYVNDKEQPLPQSDEVLMCTPNTTKDEVDIFWRRAIFDGSRKIHCLVNADMLDYDVSEAAERCLEEYLLDVYHEEDLCYRLLVICSSDNEYRSTIISSLDKYKRQLLPFSIEAIRQYLADKLKVQQNPQAKIKPAAHVDIERSTVRIIKSWRAGVGKSLFKTRRTDDLSGLNRSVRSDTVSIPLQEKNLDLHYVIERLLEHSTQPGEVATRLFHIDVSHEVQNGIDYLLFNLLILGCLMDKTGWVWRKSIMDMYLIETMPLMMQAANRQGGDLLYVHPMLNILPDLTCRSPVESVNIYMDRKPPGYKSSDQLFDVKLFRSPMFQRPFQYLLRLDHGRQLTDVNPHVAEGDPQNCLQTLLRHCGLDDPSWSELHHFVWFLNTQLVDFEKNNFVGVAAAEDLPGFSKFVLRFLIQMSRDFSTRSLDMSEESPGVRADLVERDRGIEQMETGEEDEDADDLQAYQMRRTWESSPHPYLFFNSDRFTFTFLGFNIERASGNLIDQQTGTVLDRGIMAQNLYDALIRNHAPLQENFDALPRHEKILKLCNVMGIDMPHDPDDSYELTTDNVKKILAIYMRFRCDIPVIIMGETGCGKTRLIKFMCALQVPPGMEINNMILMKVHGGTTHADIVRKVREAEEEATRNREEFGERMYTVLFFDEANTTEAIGLIKEIMCDKSMGGKKLKLCENLKIVAACNPYRKHSDELIKKLEQAGLGYHVDADETTDRLGRVPMRRLVYRVQPLPHSLLPLVWDFGQLNTQVEDLYIRQMVRRYIHEDMLPNINGLVEVVSAILTASQEYMRDQKDECSFVSLRDVNRVLTVMSWFYQQSEHSGNNGTLYKLMDEKLYHDIVEDGNDEYVSENDEEEDDDILYQRQNGRVDDVTRSLILAIGVCYHACLKTRPEYRTFIARYFRAPCHLPGKEEKIKEEIESCQEVYLDHVQLEKNIARNMALKENVFMMVVCVELRIPLFLVGKPGSSKSLAKTIVSDAMQGNAARQDLFRELKQAQMVSFQCSPLSTPDGIVGTFRQCAQFQKDKDLDTFVSVVVLDEVGLAEDSPRMPLKTLHPLLEDGCQGEEKPEKHKKVAFIGISNWALDPAKMNRGILVQREVPDLEELINSALGICSTEDNISTWISPLIEPMAVSYLEIFKNASKEMREFYGLRDFYSLVKMVYSFVEKSKAKLTWFEMLHSIKRNFGGLDQVNPVDCFKKHLSTKIHIERVPRRSDPDCSPAGLIQACLFDTNEMKSESRYLLLLTENYGALSIIQQEILSRSSDIRPITIFGSSFRSDQEYTQVCRNINKIKVCMETGNTVVLLNLENLYESLYDALNQYYVYFGGERYVDLGLGTHRVKCPVHKKFRLIVVAEKQTVYDKFPIPLINRLEKHFLTINTMLIDEQQQIVDKLEAWAKEFVKQKKTGYRLNKPSETKVGDVFIGFHDDTCSAIVLDVWEKYRDVTDNEKKLDLTLQEAKSVLLWCATPESLVRLEHGNLPSDERKLLNDIYHNQQAHDSLIQYLNRKFVSDESHRQLLAQVTTHSKLIAAVHKGEVSKATHIDQERIMLLETLSYFDTEQQFTNRILQHIKSTDKEPSLMIIQCDSGDVNANLIACARYCIMDEFEKLRDEMRAPIHVVFIVQLPRGSAYTGFQCGMWHSLHIDDLYTEDMNMPTLKDMQGKSVAGLFNSAVQGPEPMEVEDISANITEAMETEDGVRPPLGAIGGMDTDEADMEHAARMHDGPLQLDDVLLNLKSVDESSRGNSSEYGKHKLNVKGLILNCVQAALCMVKDKVENTNKETDRVSMVLTLLHQEQIGDQASFLHGICSMIAKLLKDKESRTLATHMSHHWLINEAASNENINRAGTFRRSCLQTLENKIAPILAGIIACLDTNDNLKILQDKHYSWKQRLWLGFLNTQNAIDLQYKDLESPTRQSELKEVVVMTTGCEGHSFVAKFPFSWLVIAGITELSKTATVTGQSKDHEDEDEEVITNVEKAASVLQSHPVGDVINRFTDQSILEEALEDYIQDFVHTVYNASSVQEQQLVCQSVLYKAKQMINDSTHSGVLHSLVFIHLAYQSLAPRLTYFRAMNSVWPQCGESIINLKQQNPDHFMFKEQEFTFSAVGLLIDNLTPKGHDLNEQLGRSKWLNKVHRYRPVVEKVISLHGEDPKRYGNHSFQSVDRAKALWSRVLVVKLFLEHVCASDKEEKITIKHCMPLWTVLGDGTDFKVMKSLSGLEKFLKSCNKQAWKQYIGSEVKCCSCESVLEGPPITLPCGDALCDQCYDDLRVYGEIECGKCHKKVPESWTPTRQDNDKEAVEKFKNYQKRCNTFFMDVVSQLCFADNTAPSDEVVEKLLGYIFFTSRGKQLQRTRDLTVFDTGIDPNPVFRSFLLQLLMKTSEEHVQDYLSRFLRRAEHFIKEKESGDQALHFVELSLLVIQCIEDKLVQEANRVDVEKNHEAQCALEALLGAKHSINVDELTVEKLYALARARMGLSVAMKYVAVVIKNGLDQRHVGNNMRRVIDAAWSLSDESNIDWIRIFAVKYLCRCYGIEMYQAACRHPANFIHWLADRQNVDRDQVVEVSDRYIVSGDSYTRIRESLTKVLLGEKMEHLEETLQELHANGSRVETMLQLAVHREVTCSNVHNQQQRRITPQAHQAIAALVGNCDIIKNKDLMHALVQNQLQPEHLVSVTGQDLRVQGVQCLIVHFLSVMSHLKGDRTLLQPLINLLKHPQNCTQFYLPTMPQDDLDDVKEALLAARQQVAGADNNPVFYRCPNGHPYVIGDCGRPATVGNCRDCGAVIGGEGYRLRPGNIQDQGGDHTMTGHILGRADVRGRGPKPERMLTPAYCATIRMIVHLSMYLGCKTNPNSIQAMIKPDITQDQVIRYIWSHIQQDIDDIHVALGRSVDDVLLIMHVIIDNILKTHNQGDQVAAQVHGLSNKAGRTNWEVQFSGKYVQPVLQVLDNVLKNQNQLLAKDERLGANPLLCLLYETKTHSEAEDPSVIQQIPRVWRYRTPISLQHLRQEVDARIGGASRRQKQYTVLQLFLKEEHHLRALRFIPSILRLHRALFQKYQRKLDKAEASQVTVLQLKRDSVAGEETVELIQDFSDAWELVRENLMMYMCPTVLGGMIVPKEYCTLSINDTTPISMLLPTIKEAGLCSYALLDFLMRKQNDFLDRYLKESRRKSSSISSVSPREVTSAHLISYDPEHDILPLVLANCQYSFEMGKGTKIEYDFAGLERQIMDRFLFSKSRIDVGSVLQIDEMLYRTEFTNALVFLKLAEKIPQSTLNAAVKTQITEEFKSFPDLCQSLDNLDITISFLKSTGGPEENNLHRYMVETLRMNELCIGSQRARQMCEFRDCKSLWLLLSMLKAKKMVDSRQHTETTFESVSKEFHEEIPLEVKTQFRDYMKNLSVEKLSQLVEVLHEFILLKVAVRENPDSDDYIDTTNNKLKDYLYAYIDQMENVPLDVNIFAEFPADILYKHSVHTWITAYNTLCKKQNGCRRH